MDFRVIVLFSMTVIFFGFWLLVLLKGPRQILNRIFSIFVVNMALWSFGLGMFYKSQSPEASLFWANVLYLAGSLIPAAFLHFSFIFPSGKMSISRFKQFLIYVPNIILFYLFFFTPIIVKGVTPLGQPKGFIYGSGHILWDLQFDTIFAWAFVRFYMAYKRCTGIVRMRLRYVIFGTLTGVILAGLTNVIMPWFNRFELLWLAPPLTLTWLGCITYAILKYHLMDIKVALTRTGIFVIVYTMVLGIPLILGYRYGLWQIAAWLMLILATSGPFIFQYLQHRAEDIFLKDQRRYQKTLRELSKTMTRFRDLDKLFQVIVSTVIEQVKVSFSGVYLKDEEYKSFKLKHYFPQEEKSRFQEFIPLDHSLIKVLYKKKAPLLSEEIADQDKINLDAGLVIPCFMEDNLLGFMVLGAKPNNQMYTQDDLIVFETLSYSTSLAIENSQFWKEIEEHQRQARIKEMDLFSYSLAHEIDNPMSSIRTAVIYLKDYFLKELNLPLEKEKEMESGLNSILGSQERVSAMVKAIEEFGKKTTGEFSPLSFEDVLKSYLDFYSPEFKYHGIFFTKEVPDKIPYIRGSKQELMQVLVNFSNNSMHALLGTKEKKVHLKVEIPNSDFIRIIFKDNGYGISEEKVRSIFAPFVTTKASTEGRGMGLYTIRRIIERHKGRVWAESEGKGQGAAFIIELPIARDVSEEGVKKEEDRGKRLF